MQTRVRKLAVIAMLSALAYAVMLVGRIPVVMFLKYDPKDVIIVIGGFLFGPLTSVIMSAVVSFIEMFTASETGPIGLVMNVVSTCSFACAAAVIYKKKHTIKGAVIGLLTGMLLATAVMLLWNYLITPIYMGQPREAIAKMLIPVFLPFNLIKGGLNAAITIVLYKPVARALRKSKMLPASGETVQGAGKANTGIILGAFLAFLTCVLFIFMLQGRI